MLPLTQQYLVALWPHLRSPLEGVVTRQALSAAADVAAMAVRARCRWADPSSRSGRRCRRCGASPIALMPTPRLYRYSNWHSLPRLCDVPRQISIICAAMRHIV